MLTFGEKGVYVLVLQDGLNNLGFPTGGLDGVFGNNTRTAVRNFQSSRGLLADGIVGCSTWTRLQSEVVGRGRTSTTLD